MPFGIHHGPSDAMHNPSQPLKSDTKVFTVSMEILPEPTSNKLYGRKMDMGAYKERYEHVGPKSQDHKKAKYCKDDQVTMKDLKGKVQRQRQRQRDNQDQDHKSVIGTRGTSSIYYTNKTQDQDTKHQRSNIKVIQRDLYDHPLGGEF
ncbi:hypothetical protein Tco_0026890 [Tanacetum coccineum]